MRSALLALLLVLCSSPALAQPELFFGTGTGAPNIKEEDFDRRFLRSGFYQGLSRGTNDANCARLLGGMLTLLAETAPLLHKRDENFYLDAQLIQALNTQLSTPRFQANVYLVAMVRRVLIEQKLPASWFETASVLGPLVLTIDVGKLRFLSEGLQPLDSYLLTLPALRERYVIEVQRATASTAKTADKVFRENYLDKQVAFGALELLDVTVEKPKVPKRKKGEPVEDPPPPTAVARMAWIPPDPNADKIDPFGKYKRLEVRITAKLAPQQFLDLSRIPKGTRLMVRGRLWDYSKAVDAVELRDALIFQDRDWSQGSTLVDPASVAQCPFATNELLGAAPTQSGAFGQQRR